MFYKATEKVANLFDDDSTIVSKAKFEAKHGKGPKIITPKQVLQRLTIALALVKAGKTPENLLNEIRQIICFLYQAKQITKKVYNNITSFINL